MDKLNNSIKRSLIKILAKRGFKILNTNHFNTINDLTNRERNILNYIIDKKLTMTSKDNLAATILSVRYTVRNNIGGDFVECGVWRGGHSIAAALTFELYDSDKKVFCFDTFQGMTKPTYLDKDTAFNSSAMKKYSALNNSEYNAWCYSPIDEVINNFNEAGISSDRFKLIKGDVLETLPKFKSGNISILRLDTDWYESTRKELEFLWPKLTKFGVLIIDDYGHWAGSKKAVDEFFKSGPEIFLNAIDYTARSTIKLT
jgi:O-methyltransferase